MLESNFVLAGNSAQLFAARDDRFIWSQYKSIFKRNKRGQWTLNNLCELGLTATGFIEQYRGSGCRVYSFLPTYSSRYVLVLASQYDELKKQTTFATGFEAVGSKKITGSLLTLSLDEGILSLDRKLIWYTQNGYQQDESACTLHEVMNEDDISVCAELVAESRFILDEVKRHVERGLDTYLRND